MAKTRAVVYARYSSHNQREESIEGQLRVCHQYAERMGLEIIREYTDSAISGRTDNRPAFQQMMAEAPRLKYELVLVYKLDRFARNRYVSATHKNKLKKLGIRVVSATETISDGADGVLMESILEGFAEYYSVNLSENVRRGMTENALHCKSNGAPPLGYTVKDGSYVIEPIGAKAVQIIFDQYQKGEKIRDIVAFLNEQGFKTRNGTEFKANSLHRILSNKKYMGVYIFADHEVEDGMPAIVSKEQFEAVQSMLEARRRKPGRGKAMEEYLLSGKIFCGTCGSPMIGMSGTSKTGEIYRYYACGKKRRSGAAACPKTAEKKEDIEAMVLAYICDKVLTDDVIHELAERCYAQLDEECADKSRLAIYEQRLNDTDIKIGNILKAIEAGIFTPATKDRLEALEAERSELECQVVAERLKKPEFSQAQIEFWLQSFKSGNVQDPDYQKAVIGSLLNAVYIFDADEKKGEEKKIAIALNLKNTPTETLKCSHLHQMVERRRIELLTPCVQSRCSPS